MTEDEREDARFKRRLYRALGLTYTEGGILVECFFYPTKIFEGKTIYRPDSKYDQKRGKARYLAIRNLTMDALMLHHSHWANGHEGKTRISRIRATATNAGILLGEEIYKRTSEWEKR